VAIGESGIGEGGIGGVGIGEVGIGRVAIGEGGMAEVGMVGRLEVVVDRIFAEAEDGDRVCDICAGIGCDDGLVREDESRYGLVLDRLFAVADERVYGRRRNRKWAGEMAEAAFLHKAMELGLVVSKPWGENSRYDFVVDTGERLLRVQVKSTSCLCGGRYAVAAHGSDPKTGYSAEDIDFLVAHVPPEEAWYVIPVEAFAPHLHLWLYPRGEHAGQYEKYREAWELLGAGVRT